MGKTVTGNRIPLYQQVAKKLKQEVRCGRYEPGKPLPTVRRLSEEYAVSLRVIQQAIGHLKQEGAVVTHQGKGMLVADADSCKKASFLFGLVQPFSPEVAFCQQVVLYAEEAFDNRDNLMIVRSSKGQEVAERDVVKHLIHNGVQGVLLWPMENTPNGEFFQKISERTPVVLIDRKLPKSSLPSVTLDMLQAGKDVCEHFLGRLKKKRLLVLMDNLQISPDFEFIQGMQEKALEMSRMVDLTVTQLPITDFISELNRADYSSVETYRRVVAKLVIDGKFDAVFCPQEEFLESVVIETGMGQEIQELTLGAMTGPVLTRGRKYNEFGVVRWMWDFPEMISQAANILQHWVISGKRPAESVQIRIPLME